MIWINTRSSFVHVLKFLRNLPSTMKSLYGYTLFLIFLCLSCSVVKMFFLLCFCKAIAIGQDTVLAISDMNPVVCELELCKSQKEDSNAVIQCLQIKPTSKSRFSIPLCRLRGLPLVRPISEVEVQRLEWEFVMAYREEERVLYVSAFNNVPVDLPVSPTIMATWSPL